MTVLVTGTAGFIGAFTCQALAVRGERVAGPGSRNAAMEQARPAGAPDPGQWCRDRRRAAPPHRRRYRAARADRARLPPPVHGDRDRFADAA